MRRRDAFILILCAAFIALAWVAFSRPDIVPLMRRHGLPEIEAHITGHSAPHSLSFVYWENGTGINLNDGHVNQKGGGSTGRVSGYCDVVDGVCTTAPSRGWELLGTSPRPQGLAVYVPRHLGTGIGAKIRWLAPSHPRIITLDCNFDETDSDRRCRVTGWTM